MRGLKPVVVLAGLVTLFGAGAAWAPGRIFATSIQCSVIPEFGIGCSPLGGCSPILRYIAIRNTLSSPIAAGTVYTYQLAGDPAMTYQHPTQLAPGEFITIQVRANPPDTCTATIPGSPFAVPFEQLQQFELAPVR